MSSVTSAYAYTVKPIADLFAAIQRAQVPPKFTQDFLKTLGFKSTNDRAMINVLKGLGFLDANAAPTQVYRDYRDKGQARQVLARQLRAAYAGLFQTDDSAQTLPADTVKDRLASITGKDESVVQKMAATFKALTLLADFSTPPEPAKAPKTEDDVVESPALDAVTPRPQGLAFAHTIYVNLPTTRDSAVYDAIFKSIREHLL